jgi:glycosyltransferase involved in cell wall biosynthesis
MEKAGFQWRAFPFSRYGINPFQELRTLWSLFRFYRKEKPDLVHHFTIKCVFYGSIAAQAAGISKIINSITGLGYVFITQNLKARFIRKMVKWFYPLLLKSSQVIFQNEEDIKVFQSLGLVRQDQIHLIQGSGVSLERFDISAAPDGIPLVVLPGRMLFAKGVSEFVEASRILQAEGVKARFILVGNIDRDDADGIPEKQISEWQNQGIIEWWGWHENIGEVFQQANIICLPSYREGLPRALIEAMACGRPLVATDVPGCRDVVEEGVNGCLVPVRDPQALADALRTLIERPDLRVAMGEASRRIVEERFSEKQVIRETLKLYGVIV